ncbi:MAG: HEAT repeat domain-containing protein [Chitinispirillaceae bacterium]|nr:HEAT repeat domain-containing protein [Chitinispirillaceae bacterium]
MTPEQIEQARKGLSSDNPAVVIYALKGLGGNGKLTDLQAVMKLVASPNQKIKQSAIEATCTLIKENLINHFHELDTSMRQKLATIMQSVHPSVLDEISKDLYSDNDDRRLRAVQILGHMRKNPKIKDILVKLVQDRDVKIKATAANLMGRVIGQNDHDLLLALLNDEDNRVRANTIEALEQLNNKRLIPILLRFKKDPNNRIRGNVLKALHTLGHTGIEEELLEMINSASNLMKASGMWVVSQIRFSTRPVIDACGLHLLSRDDMVHRNARNAVTAIDDPRARGYLRYLADFFPSPSEAVAATPQQALQNMPKTAKTGA